MRLIGEEKGVGRGKEDESEKVKAKRLIAESKTELGIVAWRS
jgi:hypothetical protein